MGSNAKIRLTIPRQDLDEFSLFPLTSEDAIEWSTTLPVAHPQKLAEILSRALADFNRIKLSPELRYNILEALRPSVDIALTGVCKKYLNQPLVMPAEPARFAGTARQLFNSTNLAYTIVAVEAIQFKDTVRDTSPARLACESIQRALHYCGLKILQAYQLYRPIESGTWHSLHQLFALAEDQELSELPVETPTATQTSIKATYLQSILLSCCKPNQLRQSDLASAFNALEYAAPLVTLNKPKEGSGLFIVNLAGHEAPGYSAVHPQPWSDDHRLVGTESLVENLQRIAGAEPEQGESIGNGLELLPTHLQNHMVDSLGQIHMRNFKRNANVSGIRICLGLSSSHFHVAGCKDFKQLIGDTDYIPSSSPLAQTNPFMNPLDQADVWQRTRQSADYLKNEWLPGQVVLGDVERRRDLDDTASAELLEEVEVELPLDQRYPVFAAQLADASPSGYCIEWSEELPTEIRAGDIVSVMEDQNDTWSIAVIRWLSQLKDAQTLIGMELLSPRAIAYGALIHQKDGSKTAPMRALLLPEIKLVGQPNTLVTPRASFRERLRVSLVNEEETHTVQLTRQIAATASYSQYEFSYVTELGDVLAGENPNPLDSPYDSLWSNI